MNLTAELKLSKLAYNVMDEHGNVTVEAKRNVEIDHVYRNGDFVANTPDGPIHVSRLSVVDYQFA